MKLCTAKYEVYMQRFFYRLGFSIGSHPWRYIIGVSLFTLFCAVGLLRFKQISNARQTFTASDSASHEEGRMIKQFLGQNGSLHMIEVMIKAADNGSLLRDQFLQQFKDITNEIRNNITVQDKNGKWLTYSNELCNPYCQKNDAIFLFLELFDKNHTNSEGSIELTYPTMELLGRKVFLAANIYNPSFVNHTNIIDGFTTAILRFYMTHQDPKLLVKWEDKLVELLYESHKYPLLRGGAGSDNLVAKEVKSIGTKTAPLLGIALGLLMLFLFVCSFRHKMRESKPMEAMLGGCIPILASVATVGLVSATGLAFQSIIVSTLFLILAIGIDDVFLMLSEWHRTEKSLSVPERTGEMARVAFCSMTVTTVTNVVSFGNGVFSTTPVLQTFAIYSAVASIICYVFQMFLFPAILAISAPREYASLDEKKEGCLPEEIAFIPQCAKFNASIWKFISVVVERWPFRFAVIAILIAYWALSTYGIAMFKTDLSIQKMGDPDSRIVLFKTEYDHVIKAMQTVAILVDKPGDLRDPKQLKLVQNMIRDYETADYSYGNESTYCWLQPYLDHLAFFEAEDDTEIPPFTYKDLPAFLATNSIYNSTLHVNETACLRDEPDCLTAFLFTTGFSGKADYCEMYPLIESWREIASRYPSLHVYTYTERHNFADQSNDMQSIIWQTAMSEVICMGLSFLVFVPDAVSILAAMFSLLSVNMGVLGFLSLWDVGMDPVSMASLLMSIGFSVDICSHIVYHFYEVKAPTVSQRLEESLSNIGWPTMQGGLSTMLAMLPILFRPTYLSLTFLKTVILVTISGLVHGLIILPVFLSIFTQIYKAIFERKKQGDDVKGKRDDSSSGSDISIEHSAVITNNNNKTNNNNNEEKL